MTIELAPHHMLIVTDYWMIIPWSDLRKSRSFPGFCSMENPGSEAQRRRTGRVPCCKSLRKQGTRALEGQGM